MKYTKAMIEAIELEVEDVVLTSTSDCTTESTCASEVACPNDDTPSCRTEIVRQLFLQ